MASLRGDIERVDIDKKSREIHGEIVRGALYVFVHVELLSFAYRVVQKSLPTKINP